MTPNTEQVLSLVHTLSSNGFWGALEIKFENGMVSLIRKTETVKPENINQRSNRSREHAIR